MSEALEDPAPRTDLRGLWARETVRRVTAGRVKTSAVPSAESRLDDYDICAAIAWCTGDDDDKPIPHTIPPERHATVAYTFPGKPHESPYD